MRLLEKNNLVVGGYQPKMSGNGMEGQSAILCKLGSLEDLEEKLGIDLLTLFVALENGIWTGGKDDYGLALEPEFWKARTFEIKYHKYIGLCFSKVTGGRTYNKTEDNFGFVLDYSVVKLKNYGKTWALTKEELL